MIGLPATRSFWLGRVNATGEVRLMRQIALGVTPLALDLARRYVVASEAVDRALGQMHRGERGSVARGGEAWAGSMQREAG